MISMTPRPNFFIVGAPKTGTSALYTYLREHPHIFMPLEKEPFYFLDEDSGMRVVHTEEQYLKLFAPAHYDQHHAIGEGSTLYLESASALRRIHAFNPEAKIIAILRNPVELIHAFHAQLLWRRIEDQRDFETAWRLQTARRQGQNIPSSAADPYYLQYERIGQQGAQVADLLTIFPPEQVRLYLFDDFKRDVAAVYNDALAFLGVPLIERETFERVNENKSHRSAFVSQLLVRNPVVMRVRDLLGIQHTGLFTWLLRFNMQKHPRAALSPALHAELVTTFREDIRQLQSLIGRDLSHWLAPPTEESTL